jgi:predicted nuclease of predicted toxin-antitoxin system
MKFKIDENLPIELAELLQSAGHDAMMVHDQQLQGKPDTLIAEICQAEERAIVTLDMGFSDIRRYPPAAFAGLIVLRLSNQDKFSILQVFQQVLTLLEKEPLIEHLWIVEEQKVRIRS